MTVDKITYGKTLGAKAWDKVTPQKVNEIIDTVNDITDGTYTIDDLTVETLTATTSITTDVINEQTSAAGVTIDGVLLKDSTVKTDTIKEKTAANGVNIDGVVCKDGGIDLLYGYVEQLTSLSTPVALNAPSGRITTVSTTLAALTSTTFVLTNSYIKNDSIITISCYYNGTLVTEGIPVIHISPSTPGAVNVYITNVHPTNALNNAVDIAFTIV